MIKNLKDVDFDLTFGHYKEPLTKIPKGKGYGYWGALLSSPDGEYIQCHICGNLYGSLALHIYNTHKMRTRAYKERFKLAYLTALVSENLRAKLKENTLNWLSKLTPEQKKAMYKKIAMLSKGRRSKFQPKLTLETKNKRDVCPEQILEKIKLIKEKLGRVPTLREFVEECGTQRYKHLIYKVYGSWINALHMLSLDPKQPDKSVSHHIYTDEQLLEALRAFTKLRKKVPTSTDFKRKLLPDYEVYIRRFGSIEDARLQAGVYKIVPKLRSDSRLGIKYNQPIII